MIEWISINIALPKEGVKVLVWYNGHVCIGEYMGPQGKHKTLPLFVRDDDGAEIHTVTAWTFYNDPSGRPKK